MTLDFLFRRILRRGLLQEEKVKSLCKKISLYLRSWSLAFREKDFRDHNVPGGEGLQTSDITFLSGLQHLCDHPKTRDKVERLCGGKRKTRNLVNVNTFDFQQIVDVNK